MTDHVDADDSFGLDERRLSMGWVHIGDYDRKHRNEILMVMAGVIASGMVIHATTDDQTGGVVAARAIDVALNIYNAIEALP